MWVSRRRVNDLELVVEKCERRIKYLEQTLNEYKSNYSCFVYPGLADRVNAIQEYLKITIPPHIDVKAWKAVKINSNKEQSK